LSKYFKEEMHIVLDIDGTLINDSGQPRPGLIEFLKWCEITFETVSIWTAAGQPLFKSGWVDHVIKNLLGYPIKLHKVFTANRSTYKRICFDEMYGERVIIKRPNQLTLVDTITFSISLWTIFHTQINLKLSIRHQPHRYWYTQKIPGEG
jgi:hypothetical protein